MQSNAITMKYEQSFHSEALSGDIRLSLMKVNKKHKNLFTIDSEENFITYMCTY